MKKVLFFSTLESVPWGGSEQMWYEMAKRLLVQGHHVITNTLEWENHPDPLAELQEQGGVLTFRPNIHLPRTLGNAASNKLKSYKWKTEVLDFNPDVVFISQGGAYDNALLQNGNWLRQLNKPMYVMSQYMNEYEYMSIQRRSFFRDFMPAAEKVLFVSKRNYKNAQRTIAQTISNAQVIKNPIKLKDTTEKYPETKKVKIAVVARLEHDVKGFDLIMETFSQSQWQNRDFEVNIYGSGIHEEYIRELIKYHNLEDKVILKGFESNVVNIWNQNQILLLPSRGEGTPLSLLEASYCKRPAVVTDVGGNAEVVDDGVSGFVAAAPVVSCVSEAMERAWEERDHWEEMGLAAKNKVDKLYQTDAVDEAISLFM